MIFYSQWLNLPINTRHKIASEFGVAKKLPTHVQDNVIVSDGYNVKDVESALSIGALQHYLNVDSEDINILWNELVFRIENPDVPIIQIDEVLQEQKVELIKEVKEVKKNAKTK